MYQTDGNFFDFTKQNALDYSYCQKENSPQFTLFSLIDFFLRFTMIFLKVKNHILDLHCAHAFNLHLQNPVKQRTRQLSD